MRFFFIFTFLLIAIETPVYSFNNPTYNEAVANPVFSKQADPSQKNVFIFDPKNLQWAVYDKNGDRVGIGKGVGGKDFCPDINKPCRTVEGTYTIFRTENKECTSKTFPVDEGGGAPMPHCMFFYKGYAIHGSNNLPNNNASHGCIRISKSAAEWMNTYYIQPGSMVVVLPYKS